MGTEWIPVAATGLTSVIALTVGEAFRRRKTKAEASDSIANAAHHLVETYAATLDRMQTELDKVGATANAALLATTHCESREKLLTAQLVSCEEEILELRALISEYHSNGVE